jgi:hypothetical protein
MLTNQLFVVIQSRTFGRQEQKQPDQHVLDDLAAGSRIRRITEGDDAREQLRGQLGSH